MIELWYDASGRLACEEEMVLLEGAGHMFKGSATLDRVVEIARGWLASHLGGTGAIQAPADAVRRGR